MYRIGFEFEEIRDEDIITKKEKVEDSGLFNKIHLNSYLEANKSYPYTEIFAKRYIKCKPTNDHIIQDITASILSDNHGAMGGKPIRSERPEPWWIWGFIRHILGIPPVIDTTPTKYTPAIGISPGLGSIITNTHHDTGTLTKHILETAYSKCKSKPDTLVTNKAVYEKYKNIIDSFENVLDIIVDENVKDNRIYLLDLNDISWLYLLSRHPEKVQYDNSTIILAEGTLRVETPDKHAIIKDIEV